MNSHNKHIALIASFSILTLFSLAQAGNDSHQLKSLQAEDLIELSRISNLTISPDQSMLAYFEIKPNVLENSYSGTWNVISVNNSPKTLSQVNAGNIQPLVGPRGFRSGAIRAPSAASWSPDSSSIAFIYQSSESDILSAYNVKKQLYHNVPTNGKSIVDFCWGDTSDEIIFTTHIMSAANYSEKLAGERPGGFLFDDRFMPAHSVSPRRIPKPSNVWNVFDINSGEVQEAKPCLQSDSVVRNKSISHFPDHATNIAASQSGDVLAWTEPASFLPGGRVALVPEMKLMALDQTNQELLLQCADPKCFGHLTKVWVRAQGKQIIFGRRTGANLTEFAYYLWDLNANVVQPVFEKPDEWVTGCVPAMHSLVCTHEAPTSPNKIISIDIDTGNVNILVDPNPSFHTSDFVEVQRVEWKGDWEHWGQSTFGHLVLPKHKKVSKKYPLVIVQYYSQGFLRGGVGDEYPILLLAANGFAVLRIERPIPWAALANVSDSQELERLVTFGSGNMSDWDAGLASLEAGLDHVLQIGIIDEDRIGITGLSDGAVKALHGLVNTDRFHTAALSSTAWDPIIYFAADDKFRAQLRNIGFQFPFAEGFSNWKAVSPSMNANEIDAPILFHLADRELVKATQMLTALKEHDKLFDAFIFENEYHVKWQPIHRFHIYNRNLDWFNFWLRDVEDPDPEKAEQYDRWRQLRKLRDEKLSDVN